MTDENLPPKVKVTNYSLGDGDYLSTVPTVNGVYCWGYIAGEHIEVQKTNLDEVTQEVIDSLTKAHLDYTKKAMKQEAVALKIKENGLEKFAQTDGDHKTNLDWVKD